MSFIENSLDRMLFLKKVNNGISREIMTEESYDCIGVLRIVKEMLIIKVKAAFEFETEELELEFENGGYDIADDAVEM